MKISLNAASLNHETNHVSSSDSSLAHHTATQQAALQLGQTLKSALPDGALDQAASIPVSIRSPNIDISNHIQVKQWDSSTTELNYEPIENIHFLNAVVSNGKTLSFYVRAKGNRSTLGSGQDMFIGLMKKLEDEGIHINAIETHWEVNSESVNASAFLKNLEQGMNQKDAAANTWTGRMVGNYGFKPDSFKKSGTCHYVIFKKDV